MYSAGLLALVLVRIRTQTGGGGVDSTPPGRRWGGGGGGGGGSKIYGANRFFNATEGVETSVTHFMLLYIFPNLHV